MKYILLILILFIPIALAFTGNGSTISLTSRIGSISLTGEQGDLFIKGFDHLVVGNDSTLTFIVDWGWNTQLLNSTRFTYPSNLTLNNHSPTLVQNWDHLNISIGVTSNETGTEGVNFTITAPNGSKILDRVSGINTTPNVWNSTSFTITDSGTWGFNATYWDYQDDINFKYWSVVVPTDSVTISPSIQRLISDNPRNATQYFNLSLYHNTKTPINYTFSGGMDNYTCLSLNLPYSDYVIKNYSITDPFKIPVNIVNNCSNDSVAIGVYKGRINITRIIDGTEYNSNISLSIGQGSGEIWAINTSSEYCSLLDQNCYQDDSILTSESIQYNVLFNNTGTYNLTSCTPSLGGTFAGQSFITYSNSSFSVDTHNTTQITIYMTTPTSGSYTGFLEVTCSSDALLNLDTLSSRGVNNQPYFSLLVTAPTEGGSSTQGGGGDTPSRTTTTTTTTEESVNATSVSLKCGNGLCEPGEDPGSCPEDCKVNLDTIFCLSGEHCVWRAVWFSKLMVFAGLGIAIMVVYRRIENQNKNGKR